MSELTTNSCCNSVVTILKIQSQKSPQKPAPTGGAQKTYRVSQISRTVRVPNELLSRVNKLIADYRTQQRSDPDTY